MSTSYHPQSDDQIERVNQCLENYLRCMTFQDLKKWCQWLPLAEVWYNTSYHTSIIMTPFQALYGYPAPLVNEFAVPRNSIHEVPPTIQDKERIIQKLKHNMAQAKSRTKIYADKHISGRTFAVGDIVYLKMQPYRETTLGLRKILKVAYKFYGPFGVIQYIGQVAYKLLLPDSANIHPVFHVSQLKRHMGRVVPNPQSSFGRC